MRSSVVFVAALVASVIACVGNDPVPTNGTPSSPDASTPTSSGTSTSSSSSSSSGTPAPDAGDTSNTDAGDAGPQACQFQPYTYPCGGQQPANACFGDAQSCTATGCGGTDMMWSCDSPNQCSGTACCVASTAAQVSAGADCTTGTLLITTGTTFGAACATALQCDAGATQLCQANSQCPKGQRCVPVKLANAGAAFSGKILGACAP